VKYLYQRKSVKIFAGYGEQIRQKTLFLWENATAKRG